MAHEIMELDRPVFGSNVPAWHGLGRVRPGQFGSAAEAVADALAFRVDTEPAFTADGLEIPGCRVTVRDDLQRTDDRRILGTVGDVYQVIQNHEAAELLDAFAGETGCKIETVGSLRNGKAVWLLGLMPDRIKVKDDTLAQYVLVRSAHDGSASLEVFHTSVRVVCANTLAAAVNGSDCRTRIRHTSKAQERLAEARRAALHADKHFAATADVLNHLADVTLEPKTAAQFLQKLVPDKPDDSDQAKKNHQARRYEIAKLWDGAQRGASQAAVRGTAYGMLQAATEYADHYATVRRSGGATTAEARLESVLWGSAADLKQQALDGLLSMIDLQPTPSHVDAIIAQIDCN